MKKEMESVRKNSLWNPARELSQLQKTFHRLFNSLSWSDDEDLSGIEEAATFSPACDVSETDKAFEMTFDVPGIPQENLKVEVNERELTVSGEREEENDEDEQKSKHLVERYHGQFRRTFTIPNNVSVEGVVADYENGMLKITLPKVQSKNAKQIKIGGEMKKPSSMNVAGVNNSVGKSPTKNEPKKELHS